MWSTRKLICLAVAFSLFLSLLGGTASAAGKAKPWEQGLKLGVLKKVFADQDDAPWASGYMAKMKLKGLMQGYPGGKFMPNSPISRVELVVLAVRARGLEEEAQTRNGAVLSFDDARQIYGKYPWAVGYLATAVRDGLIPSKGKFQPDKAATRVWAAEVLIKAVGLEDEAEDKMDADLPYADKKEIPAGKIGYVAVALERGIMMGYGNTFKPNAPIKRCEVAAVLDRMEETLPPTDYEVRGIITSVRERSNSITVQVFDNRWWDWKQILRSAFTGSLFTGSVTITVSEEALILFNKELADLGDLETGYRVTVLRNSAGKAVLVDASTGGKTPNWPDAGATTKTGEVEAITLGSSPKIRIEDKDGRDWTYSIASGCDVEDEDGDEIDLDDIEVGDEVTIRIVDSKVTKITVEDGVSAITRTGEVEAITLGSSPKIRIEDKDGRDWTYSIASGCDVEDEDGDEIDLDDIEVGDEVTIRIVDSKVTKITAEDGASAITRTGEVLVIDSGSTPEITIEDSNGNEWEYAIASGCDVEDEDGDEIDLDDIEVGDEVTLTIRNSKVQKIVVEEEAVETEKDGVVTEIRTASPRRISIELSNGSTFTAALSSSVVVKEDGDTVTLSDVHVGDEVHLRLRDGYVVRIEITEPNVHEVKGTVTQVETGSSRRIWIRLSGGAIKNYVVDSGVEVTFEDDELEFADVVPDDEVVLTLAGSKVTDIKIEDRPVTEVAGTITALATGVNGRTITIKDSSNVTRTYKISTDATFTDGEEAIRFASLDEGDQVILKLEGRLVTRVTVTG